MRRLIGFLFLLAVTLAARAQTPVPLPITGNLGTLAGAPQPYAGVEIQLQNCASPVTITGFWGIVAQTYQLRANASGLINSTVWANDQITCNGTTGANEYSMRWIVNGVPSGTPTCYQVVSTQGQWNLNTQQPIDCTYTPPNPQDGSFNNLTVSGFFQGNNGEMSGQWTVLGMTYATGGITLGSLPTACTGANFMVGLSVTLQPVCTALPSFGVLSFNGRTGSVVPVSGDYSFSLISGSPTPTQIAGAGTLSNSTSGNAATATALAAAPTHCGSTTPAYGIGANGNALCIAASTLDQYNTITGCSYPNDGANLSCTMNVTLGAAMPDTSYIVSCTVNTSTSLTTVVLDNISPVTITDTSHYSFSEITQGSSTEWTANPNYGKTFICHAHHG